MKSIKSSPVITRLLLVFAALALSGCSAGWQITAVQDEKISVVVTTTFIADILENLASDRFEIDVLLEPGQNPHSYLASPQDMVRVSNADLIFANGLGLEEFLDDMLDGTDAADKVIVVSRGISGIEPENISGTSAGDEHSSADLGIDPHVWFSPNHVRIWVENISQALMAQDPLNAEEYRGNAIIYLQKLDDLDAWIREEIKKIPPEDRELVSDHTALAYFAREYGLEQIGAVIPALTTEAETSGQELAALIETIRESQAKAIFIGVDFNPTLAQRVADETGAKLVRLYFGSLSAGPPADSYLDFMSFNVRAIVNALQD